MSENPTRFAIRSARVVFPDSEEPRPATVVIERGKISEIRGYEEEIPGCNAYDGKNLVLMPGVIDPHVHINEPGRTDWEGFQHATKSAAAGGITTVVDMPLNCLPVTTSSKALRTKLNAVEGKLWVDCGFWGGVIRKSLPDLDELVEAGVLGVKSFMIDSGIPEFPEMKKDDLEKAMQILAPHSIPYLIHAELDSGEAKDVSPDGTYNAFLQSRPRTWENNAIELLISLCKKYKCKTHIVHLSSSDALELLHNAQREHLPVSVETCPHYLTLSAESIEENKTLHKCCPPIRELENREALWNGIKEGIINFIASDHSPCTVELKKMEEDDIDHAWGGISSLQFLLPLVWTEGNKRGLSIRNVSDLLSKNTSEFLGIEKNKGSIGVGKDADLVLWNPDESFTIDPKFIYYKNKISPYVGRTVRGVVHQTFVRGQKVFDTGNFSKVATGKTILRNRYEL